MIRIFKVNVAWQLERKLKGHMQKASLQSIYKGQLWFSDALFSISCSVIHLEVCYWFPHQCVERGDRENPKASQGGFGGSAGDGQQTFWVWQLSTLKAGEVAAHPEQVHVEPLQVLLPLLNLQEDREYYFDLNWF